jgi:hypothetical protein
MSTLGDGWDAEDGGTGGEGSKGGPERRRATGERRRADGDATRPGPVFDRAMRRVAEGDLEAFCRWLRVDLEGPAQILSGSFPAATLHADLLVRVSRRRLMHVEYMRSPSPDLAVRMIGYRSQIMRYHPDMRVSQHAIVLGEGKVRSADDPDNGFTLGLRTIYLRDCDPALFLDIPGLAPLAVLAQGSRESRAYALARAVNLIQTRSGPLQAQLLEAAAVLATIRLDGPTIDVIRRESGMSVESIADFYSETEVGRELLNRGLEQGLERSGQLLSALLRDRFGEQPEITEITARLIHWPDPASAIHAVTRAETLAELLHQSPPTDTA